MPSASRSQREPPAPGTLRLRDADLPWRAVEGEVVALDARTSEYLAINESGAALWEALAQGTDGARLAEILIERFSRERSLAEKEVDAFLAALAERGLLAR